MLALVPLLAGNEFLQLVIGAEEMVDIVIPQGVVEVLAVRRVEGGDDGLHAGVGDGGGGQALVHIGVVGGVDGLVPLAGFRR